jgi:hypothetical protein
MGKQEQPEGEEKGSRTSDSDDDNIADRGVWEAGLKGKQCKQ